MLTIRYRRDRIHRHPELIKEREDAAVIQGEDIETIIVDAQDRDQWRELDAEHRLEMITETTDLSDRNDNAIVRPISSDVAEDHRHLVRENAIEAIATSIAKVDDESACRVYL